MGRGLAAIMQVSGQHGDRPEFRDISIELVRPGEHQPRRRFDQDALEALAGSIAEQGVLQPVLVRPLAGGHYELVAGERRWRAAKLAGLPVIPAIIERRDDAASLEAAIVENMARADLNPVEEARAVAALTEELGLTREEAGKRVGRGRVAISNLLRILDLPDEALALLEDGSLTEGHGRALLLAADHADRRSLARDAAAGGWSVRVLEDRARKANDRESAAAKRSAKTIHPDQERACEEIAEALAAAFGRDVIVRPKGTGYRVQLEVSDADDAAALARATRLAAVR
jgi:ParB family chromosome partitioning protein